MKHLICPQKGAATEVPFRLQYSRGKVWRVSVRVEEWWRTPLIFRGPRRQTPVDKKGAECLIVHGQKYPNNL